METKVRIAPFQEVPAAELGAMQDFMQSGVDTIVRELLFDYAGYRGFKVTKTSEYEVRVGVGRFWNDGSSFPLRAARTLSADALAPSSGRRVILVVAFSEEVASDPLPVKFLVNVNPREVTTRQSDTRIRRNAVLQFVAGVASASPARPATPPGGLVVASFLLGAGGIVGDIAMETGNEAPSLEATDMTVAVVRSTLKKFGANLETLATSVAGLSKQVRLKADKADVRETQRAILDLREATEVPDIATSFGSDLFADASETNLGASTSVVEGGLLKFGSQARESRLITLLNPIDPRLDKSESGLILPRSTNVLRIEVDDDDSEVAISSYAVVAHTLKLKKRTRSYLYYAERAPYAEVEAKLKRANKVRLLDPKTDERVVIDLTEVDWELRPRPVKAKPGKGPYWRIDVTRPTWSIGETEVMVTGARIAQTFLAPQSMWSKRLDLLFTDVDTAGDVHVAILGVDDDGKPRFDEVIARAVVPVTELRKSPAWTSCDFDPFFLARGERYAIAVITTGDHRVAVSASNDLTNGTMFISTDGVYSDGQLEKDLCFRLYGCRFNASRIVVELDDVNLAGGIREIAAIFTGHQPPETDLQMQAKVAGEWRTLGPSDAAVLATAPSTIGLRLVFVGTKDMMPGVDLEASRVIAARPLATDTFVSIPFTLPPGMTTDTLNIVMRLVGFDPAIHSISLSILHGAGYGTETAFTSLTTKPEQDGTIIKRFTVGGLPNINAFAIKIVRTTTNLGRTFSVAYYNWYKV